MKHRDLSVLLPLVDAPHPKISSWQLDKSQHLAPQRSVIVYNYLGLHRVKQGG